MNSLKRVRAFQIELEFEVLVFKERGKPEYPEKNLLKKGRILLHISIRTRNTTYDKRCSLLCRK